MSRAFELAVESDRQPSLIFPDRCLSCGAPREAESRLVVTKLVLREGRQVPLAFRYDVPHCLRCARATRAMFLSSLIPMLRAFVGVGVWAFLRAYPYGDALAGLGPANVYADLTIAAAAGLVFGIAAAFTADLAARILRLPFFGRALLRGPSFVTQFLEDSDYVAGLKGTPGKDGRSLTVRFDNDDIAAEFAALN
jgi:hypothetical protein